AGANLRFGLNQAAFYSRFPIDVRDWLEELKKVHSFKVKSAGGKIVNVTLRLKGMEKF
ncbi:Uncharacterized protein FKW44_021525, partial [Caligus rogercresseyi]